jgi:hypothetical protein
VGEHVTLKIEACAECPHLRIGAGYSLDGFDHGNDWSCNKAKRSIQKFVERDIEVTRIPKWCPLRTEKNDA